MVPWVSDRVCAFLPTCLLPLVASVFSKMSIEWGSEEVSLDDLQPIDITVSSNPTSLVPPQPPPLISIGLPYYQRDGPSLRRAEAPTSRRCIPPPPPLIPLRGQLGRSRDRSRSPLRLNVTAPPPLLRGDDDIERPSSPTPSCAATVDIASTTGYSERALTPVAWSEYSLRSPMSSTIQRIDDIDYVGVVEEDEVEEVSVRDIHGELRLFREEMAAATHTTRRLCEGNCDLLLGEVRRLRMDIEELRNMMVPHCK